jgi:alpha-L-arabinofuranosidase
VNVNGRQWRPNLIGYDAINVYGSPSYYAFRMFSTNVGDQILAATFSPDYSPLQGSVTRDSKTGTIYVKLVNPTSNEQPLTIEGISSIAPNAEIETLVAPPKATNSLSEPTNVVPITSELSCIESPFSHTVPAHAIVVLKLRAP